MNKTEKQKPVRTRDKRELMLRGKNLLTLEQWEKFAICPDCRKPKCAACMSGLSGLTEMEQIEWLYFSDSEEEYIPPKLWDIAIQCCACGSRQHMVDWLEEALSPDICCFLEAEEAMLRAAKEEQESQSNGDISAKPLRAIRKVRGGRDEDTNKAR
jgi:hypothetical protein